MATPSSPVVLLHQPQQHRWLSFHRPQAIVQTRELSQVPSALAQVEAAVDRGLHVAGFLSYEAAPAFDEALVVQPLAPEDAFPLLWFGLYKPADVQVLSQLPGWPGERGDRALAYRLGAWQATVGPEIFDQAIARIKQYIASGDSFQVNYTFRLRTQFQGDPWAFFLALMQAQPGNYSAFIDLGNYAICSASPELFFIREGQQFTAQPMKGTAPRGLWGDRDRAEAAALQASIKNQAENLMIVDMLRNDLGRVAQPGSVQVPSLFEVSRYPTLWQMTSTVTAHSDASLAAAIAALFPCASITGAPKARTMEIIRELECSPRRIYCGAIGHWAPSQAGAPQASDQFPPAQFNVAIRTVLIDRRTGQAEYGVGSGIVWDSDSDAEYQECCLKTEVLTRQSVEFELLETLLWQPNQGYFLRDYHLKRLQDSAEYFGYPLNLADVQAALTQAVSEARSAEQPEELKVRLRVDAQGNICTEATPWHNQVQAQPLKARLAATPIDQRSPFLYHKTTERRVYEQARAAAPDVDEVILWNSWGEVCEGCISNIVMDWQGQKITPPVESGLLPGCFRAWLLDQGTVREQVVTLEMLEQTSHFFLINSVRQWQRAVLVT